MNKFSKLKNLETKKNQAILNLIFSNTNILLLLLFINNIFQY
jgi:hypothetical protein